jgi:hypothetical protein
VDDKALHYLAALRDQVSPGAEHTGGDALNVYTGVTAVEHGIEPGSDEHDALLNARGALNRGSPIGQDDQTRPS